MKKFLYLFFPLLFLFVGCNEEKIVNESEPPLFPLREGYELLEVTVPDDTSPNDKIYIIGEFNGGEDAIGNPIWLLERARDYDNKFGIYLDPETFLNGKTLAEGYTFYNTRLGFERNLKGEPVTNTEHPEIGKRINLVVEAWADNFNNTDNPDNITHDGFTIYVYDLSRWNNLYLYSWGAVNDLHGRWPGMPVTGQQTINGVTYKYFDLGKANSNIGEQHIILNNGAGSQIDDVVIFNLDQDIYIELTSTSAIQIDPYNFDPDEPEETYFLYIENETGWNEFFVYGWGDKELFGPWPGITYNETKEIDGTIYMVFPIGEGGDQIHLIFNNGKGEDNGRLQYDAATIKVDRDYYMTAFPKTAKFNE